MGGDFNLLMLAGTFGWLGKYWQISLTIFPKNLHFFANVINDQPLIHLVCSHTTNLPGCFVSDMVGFPVLGQDVIF